jgi:AAA domain
MRLLSGNKTASTPVRLPKDVDELERLVTEVRAKLVIVDPIVAAIDTAFDAYKDQHVRSVLGRLVGLAESADCAIVLVAHLNKTPSTDAYIRIGGSVAFYNASRSVVLITADPEAPDDLRLISQRKANYSRLRPVERHRIEEVLLPGTVDPETGDPITTSRMVFLELAEDVDGADVLAPRVAGDASKEQAAIRFLVCELAGGGWGKSAELKERAAAEGHSERTLKRAKEALNIEHRSEGFPAVTYWRLPSRAKPMPLSDGPTVEPASLSQIPAGQARSWAKRLADPTDGPTEDVDPVQNELDYYRSQIARGGE